MFSDIVGTPVAAAAAVPPPVTTGDLTQGPGPSLGERFSTAAAEGFNHTLMGGAVNALTSGFYSGVQNPIDPNTGQPISGPTPEQQAVQAEQAPDQAYAAEPAAQGVLGQAATVAGTLVGGAASPESLVAGPEGYGAVRAGEALLPTVIKSGLVQGAVQGGANAVAQGENIAAGEQTGGFSPGEVAQSAGMGFGLGVAGPLAGKVVNAVRGEKAPTNLFDDIVNAKGDEAAQPAPAEAAQPAPAEAANPPPGEAPAAENPFADIVNGAPPEAAPAEAAPAETETPSVPQEPAAAAAVEQPQGAAPPPDDGTPLAPSAPAEPAEVLPNADTETNIPAEGDVTESGLAASPEDQTETPASQPSQPSPEEVQAALASEESPTAAPPADDSAPLEPASETPEPVLADARSGIGVVDQGHLNSGTSPYVQVFRDAGRDPATATSLPIHNQNRVIADHLEKTFGLRHIEMAPRQDPKEIRDQLSNFYNGGREMASALGMPNKALGLDGRLALTTKRFTKKTSYLGAYAPGNREIILPGRSNSFAHEWTHAFDHHMAEVLLNNPKAKRLLSTTAAAATGRLDKVPGSSAEGFANVMRAIYGKDAATAAEALRMHYLTGSNNKSVAFNAKLRLDEIKNQFVKNAEAAGGPKGYYANPAELLARSHEAYVSQTIRDAGGDTRGVAKPTHTGVSPEFDRLYPQEDDRARIFQAYRDMHDALRREQILGDHAAARPDGQDIIDPTQWHKMADTQADPGLTASLKREAQAFKGFRNKLRHNLGYDETAAHAGPLTLKVRTGDALANLVATARTVGNRLTKRQPKGAARDAFQEIMDKLTPAEHLRDAAHAAHRWLGPVFEEDVREHSRGNINKLTNILDAHKLGSMSAEEKLMLRHVLTEGDKPFTSPSGRTTAIPKSVSEAAGKLRFLLDQEWERNREAGIDIGYARSGYFPRQYDDHRIFGDPVGFKRQAAKLHSIMFDSEVGDDPEKLLEAHDRLPKDVREGMPQDVRDGMAALRKNLKDQDKLTAQIETAPGEDKPALQTKLDQLKGDAADLHENFHEQVRDIYAHNAANDWFTRINAGDPTDFDTRGPNAAYLNKRVLPPEADEIMRDYMVNDPTEALPSYFQSSARKIAFAKRFGVGGKHLDDLLTQASDGGARGEDIAAMRRLVETVTGRQKSGVAPPVERAINTVHAMGSIALMPRAMWSSLSEPVSTLTRTGSTKAMFEAFANQIGDIARTAGSRQRAEMANALGITISHLHDSIINDRTNAHYDDSPRLSKLMTNFYKRSGLTALTNSQRRSVMAAGHTALGAWGKDLTGTNARLARDAAAQFRELGLRDADHQAFAKFLADRPGLPTLQDLETPEGRAWGQAISRLTDKIIQDPMKVDKPLLSQSPVGRLGFGLMSFNYSFYHNVIEHFFETHTARVGEGYRDARNAGSGRIGALKGAVAPAARAVTHGLAAAAATYAAALAATTLRERLFNGATWDEHQKDGTLGDWLSDLAISRTGINGPLDPVIQAFTGLKYQRDLSSLVAGAQLGYFLQSAGDIVKAFAAPSPNTNTSDFNAIKGAWQLLAVPAMSALFSALPGGPLTGFLYGTGMQYATGQNVGLGVASHFVGPKGTGVDGTPPPGSADDTGGELNPATDELAPQKAASSGSSGTVAGIPVGLLDDLANPALRVAAPMFTRLPFVGKAAVAAAAGTAAVHGLAKEFSRFTKPDQD
jgi:hypothetical protein